MCQDAPGDGRRDDPDQARPHVRGEFSTTTTASAIPPPLPPWSCGRRRRSNRRRRAPSRTRRSHRPCGRARGSTRAISMAIAATLARIAVFPANRGSVDGLPSGEIGCGWPERRNRFAAVVALLVAFSAWVSDGVASGRRDARIPAAIGAFGESAGGPGAKPASARAVAAGHRKGRSR